MTKSQAKASQKASLLKRSGISGLVIGTLAILACELPLLIAVLGLSSVAGFAGLTGFEPMPTLEIAGFSILALSWAALIYLFVRNRQRRKSETAQ